jgi:outer membrane protein OmpA-like peptidoglycan-associated protein
MTGARLRRCPAVVAAIALTSVTAGCGQAVDASAEGAFPGGALAIVVGAHANAPAPQLAGGASAAVDMAVAQGSYLSIVVADGLPYQPSEPALLSGGAADRQRVLDDVASAAPRSPESDLLGALQLAAGSIAEQPGPHQIVVVDSGLSTSGPLEFTEPGMLDAEPQYVADRLGDLHQLPDLHGTTVLFQGLGETAEPQAALDAAHRAHLTDIWTTLARKAGAVTVAVEGPPAAPAAPATQPALAAVSTVTPTPEMTCAGNRVTISGGRLDFPRDSDVFVDLHAAVEALRPLAEQMTTGHLTAVVSGTSAAVGTPEGRDKLSENRAQAVANVLLGLGVVMTQLHVQGLGSDFPEYTPDHDDAGNLLPGAAALNDRVFIQFSGPVSCG